MIAVVFCLLPGLIKKLIWCLDSEQVKIKDEMLIIFLLVWQVLLNENPGNAPGDDDNQNLTHKINSIFHFTS